MKSILKLFQFGLLAATLVGSAYANEWDGTFTMTYVTLTTGGSPGIDGISPGDTFSGSYQYQSTSGDGTFTPSSAQGSLLIDIFMPGPFGPGEQSGVRVFADGNNESLVVSGGRVVSFGDSFEYGAFSGYFSWSASTGGGFEFTYDDPFSGNGASDAKGTVENVSRPVDPPSGPAVPDAADTFGLLAISVAACVAGRRVLRPRPVAA